VCLNFHKFKPFATILGENDPNDSEPKAKNGPKNVGTWRKIPDNKFSSMLVLLSKYEFSGGIWTFK